MSRAPLGMIEVNESAWPKKTGLALCSLRDASSRLLDVTATLDRIRGELIGTPGDDEILVEVADRLDDLADELAVRAARIEGSEAEAQRRMDRPTPFRPRRRTRKVPRRRKPQYRRESPEIPVISVDMM